MGCYILRDLVLRFSSCGKYKDLDLYHIYPVIAYLFHIIPLFSSSPPPHSFPNDVPEEKL